MTTVALRAGRFGGSSMPRAVVILGLLALALAGASGWTPNVPASSTGDLPARTTALAAAPAALRTALSASLGAQESSFAVSRQGKTLVAHGGGLSTVFGQAGPVVQSGSADLGLVFAGLGYGGELAEPGTTTPTASGNDVSYSRAGVTEWYRNGPLGLEQGFSVAQRPAAARAGGLLTVALHASGSLQASLAGSQIVFADHAGRSVFRYGDLSATDATGRSLPVKLQLRGRTVLLRVDDAGARYPLTIDPFVQQGTELTPSDEAGAGDFGLSIALSADGETALIGGPADGNIGSASGAGAAWVFIRSGATWTQQGPKLTGGATVLGSSLFGDSVGLSADGNTAVIGAPGYDNSIGGVWVFTRSGTTWTSQGSPVTANDESGASYFGLSVELSADGNTALIGGPTDDKNAGAAWVFTRSGSTWTQQGAKLTGAGETGAGDFGWSVALSADGNTALIGGPTDNNAGAAWIFARSGSTWTEQGPKLAVADETATGAFGWSTALSGDGNTALIAAPFDDSNAGAAWQFARSGMSWAQQGPKLVSDQAGIEVFGIFAALSTDGNTALLGGLNPDPASAFAFLFDRSGIAWNPAGSTMAEVPGSGLATGAALSRDGTTVMVGGDQANSDIGGVWAFTRSATSPDAPANVTATAGDGQAAVSFTAPASDGGAPVTSYTVTASPGGETASGSGSPITVTGLTDGTSYTFTVTATNSAGTGPSSSASSSVTPTAAASSGGGGGGGGGPIPDLAVTASGPQQISTGGQATYTLAVSDLNGATANDIHLFVTLPSGATVDQTSSDRGQGCTAAGAAALDCGLDFLSGTLVAHVTLTLTLSTPGEATLTATVNSAQADKNTADNTALATVQVGSAAAAGPAPAPALPVAKANPAATVTILRVQTVHLGKQPKLHVTLRLSRASTVALTLVGSTGKVVARWSLHLTAGTRNLVLALPATARYRGRDTLRVQIGNAKAKTVAVLVRP